MTRLFVFAHQDDEIGVMHTISSLTQRGERVACAYLADGSYFGADPARRNAESLRVLTALGVRAENVHFLGDQLGIHDGKVVEHLEEATRHLESIAKGYGDVTAVVTHAWEGGHQDHDATHLAGQAVARILGVAAASRQFPLYSASSDGAGKRYGVLDPAVGTIESQNYSVLQGIRQLSLLRHYRSQTRVMLRLGPSILRAWLVDRSDRLQQLPVPSRLVGRPAEHLLYEKWNFYTFSRFQSHAVPFVERSILPHFSRLGRQSS
jgi:LmbE family N-acetylglucosaminyl deacetylase